MTNEVNETILVACDSGFHNLCEDPAAYIERLKPALKNFYGDDVIIKTVSGKFGLSRVTDEFEMIEVDDRNKTQFSQTVENNTNYFDNLLIISLTDQDPFLESIADVAISRSKKLLRYKYKRKP